MRRTPVWPDRDVRVPSVLAFFAESSRSTPSQTSYCNIVIVTEREACRRPQAPRSRLHETGSANATRVVLEQVTCMWADEPNSGSRRDAQVVA